MPMPEIFVLYVDDEPALLEIAPPFLERSGLLSVTTIDSAKKALELLKTRSFDAIVSDYQMPVMDGIEFLKKIRQQYADLPFILFTGKGREEVVVDAFNNGADAYLQKGGNPVAQFVELEQKIKINVGHWRSRQALCESEKKYRQLVENAQECIFIIQDEKIAFYNPKFIEVLANGGYTCEEYISQPYYSFVHPDDQPLLRDRYHRRITNGEKFPRYSFRVISKTGAIFWWEVDAIKIFWNGQPATLNFLRDITLEYQLREQVKESENRYQELVESLPKTVIELDKRFNVTFMNRAGREKWGFASEPVGRPVFDLVHSDDQERICRMYKQALCDNLPPGHVTTALRCDGSTFPLMVYVTQILRNNSVGGFRLVCIDISEEKKLHDRLVQVNNKLNLMCKINGHDLNNKLTALLGYLTLAKEHTENPQALAYLQKIDGVADFLRNQVRFTKTYQEIGVAEPEWQPLKEVIGRSREAHNLENIDIRVDVQDIEIYADLLLEKVFYNLFHNSLCHGKHVTVISITCKKSGKSLVVCYEDNGIGIAHEDKSRIFTCGFGKNHGLGLFLIQEILAITGISITETGEPGKGARFELSVPHGSYRFKHKEPRQARVKVTS